MLVYSILMINSKNSKVLNSALAIGMALFFLGYLLILGFAGDYVSVAISILPALLFLTGLVFLYVFMVFSKTPFKLFTGLCLTLYGMFSMLLASSVFPYSIKNLWPVYLYLTAIALGFAARATGKKFSVGYDLLSIIFLVIGTIFLLFSLKVIRISFKAFMLALGPVALLVGGVILIVLVVCRKNILNMLPENISSQFSEEEQPEE